MQTASFNFSRSSTEQDLRYSASRSENKRTQLAY